MFQMQISGSDGQVLKTVELRPDRPVRVGRGQDCEVQIQVASVSRHHCEIAPARPGSGEMVVRDLNSTHGVFVRGQRVREVPVTPGLEVAIGPAVLRFSTSAERLSEEMARSVGDDDEQPITIVSSVGRFQVKAGPGDQTRI
ncbi:MAG: FHA domain-containing protein [Phycisphaerales bacterium]|nr:FHA domain-containing protein [Phycisphaerales bacterium]